MTSVSMSSTAANDMAEARRNIKVDNEFGIEPQMYEDSHLLLAFWSEIDAPEDPKVVRPFDEDVNTGIKIYDYVTQERSIASVNVEHVRERLQELDAARPMGQHITLEQANLVCKGVEALIEALHMVVLVSDDVTVIRL